MKYTIKAGDTLSGIAARFLGNSLEFDRIAYVNDIRNPDMIIVGETLEIPDAWIEPRARYTAESLEDIAQHFERLASDFDEISRVMSNREGFKRRADAATGRALGYREAARILRATKLKGL